MEKVFTAVERQSKWARGNLNPTAGSVTQVPQIKEPFLLFYCQDVVRVSVYACMWLGLLVCHMMRNIQFPSITCSLVPEALHMGMNPPPTSCFWSFIVGSAHWLATTSLFRSSNISLTVFRKKKLYCPISAQRHPTHSAKRKNIADDLRAKETDISLSCCWGPKPASNGK